MKYDKGDKCPSCKEGKLKNSNFDTKILFCDKCQYFIRKGTDYKNVW